MPICLFFALLLNYEYKTEDNKKENSNSENQKKGRTIKEKKWIIWKKDKNWENQTKKIF